MIVQLVGNKYNLHLHEVQMRNIALEQFHVHEIARMNTGLNVMQ